MKYNSLKQYFQIAESLLVRENFIDQGVKEAISKSQAYIRKKVKKIKNFLKNSFEVRVCKKINTNAFVRKLIAQQNEIKSRQDLRLKDFMSKVQLEEAEHHKILTRLNEEKNTEYKNRLKLLVEKSEQRKNALKQLETDLHGPKKEKRLYHKLEEQFNQDLIENEIKARDQFLQQRKKMFSPIRLKDIIKHSKNQSLILKDTIGHSKHQRSMTNEKLSVSPLMRIIIQREIQERNNLLQSKTQGKVNLDRRKTYAKLSQEIYKPKIDLLKKKQLQIILERKSSPVRRKIFTGKSELKSKSVYLPSKSTESKLESSNSLPQRARINYLHELKTSRRENIIKLCSKNMERHSTDKESIIKEALEMDKLSKNHEILLKQSPISDWGSIIQSEEKANNFLLQSIHSKLSLMQSLSSSIRGPKIL